MEKAAFNFSGDDALNYDQYLGPVLFEPFGKYLAEIISFEGLGNVLEIAAGTGRLTRHIAARLPQAVNFTASDLNADMLQIARQKIKNRSVKFDVADANLLPYENNSFDLVVCQFGLMFFTNLPFAISEIFRVLKPGGKFIFTTWDKTENSPLLNLVFNNILANYLPPEVAKKIFQPFSLFEKELLQKLLISNLFSGVQVNNVVLTAGNTSAPDIVNAFFLKHPLSNLINKKDPDLMSIISDEMHEKIKLSAAQNPSFYNLSALIGSGLKA